MNSHVYLPLKQGLKKKQETCYLQTWHGSMGIKKCDADVTQIYSKTHELEWQTRSSALFDYLFVNSDFQKEIYTSQHRGYGKIEMLGNARDAIFYVDHRPVIDKVKKFYQLPQHARILLYAPTWRPDGALYYFNLDIRLLKKSLKQRFGGEWVILVRLHSRTRRVNNVLFGANEVIDASNTDKNLVLVVFNTSTCKNYWLRRTF